MMPMSSSASASSDLTPFGEVGDFPLDGFLFDCDSYGEALALVELCEEKGVPGSIKVSKESPTDVSASTAPPFPLFVSPFVRPPHESLLWTMYVVSYCALDYRAPLPDRLLPASNTVSMSTASPLVGRSTALPVYGMCSGGPDPSFDSFADLLYSLDLYASRVLYPGGPNWKQGVGGVCVVPTHVGAYGIGETWSFRNLSLTSDPCRGRQTRLQTYLRHMFSLAHKSAVFHFNSAGGVGTPVEASRLGFPVDGFGAVHWACALPVPLCRPDNCSNGIAVGFVRSKGLPQPVSVAVKDDHGARLKTFHRARSLDKSRDAEFPLFRSLLHGLPLGRTICESPCLDSCPKASVDFPDRVWVSGVHQGNPFLAQSDVGDSDTAVIGIREVIVTPLEETNKRRKTG